MTEGEFKKQLLSTCVFGIFHQKPVCLEIDEIVDEVLKDFGGIILVQSLGPRDNAEETHYVVDRKYWKEVLETKKDGKHGEAWFEFEDPDKAITAFLKWFGKDKPI